MQSHELIEHNKHYPYFPYYPASSMSFDDFYDGKESCLFTHSILNSPMRDIAFQCLIYCWVLYGCYRQFLSSSQRAFRTKRNPRKHIVYEVFRCFR